MIEKMHNPEDQEMEQKTCLEKFVLPNPNKIGHQNTGISLYNHEAIYIESGQYRQIAIILTLPRKTAYFFDTEQSSG